MKYAEMVQNAHYAKVAYYTDVLNAVVREATGSTDPRKAIEAVTSNWRLTGAEHVAIVEEARRILKV